MNGTLITIITATQTGDIRIRLVFDDNTEQEIDFKPFLIRSHHQTSALIWSQIVLRASELNMESWYGVTMSFVFL